MDDEATFNCPHCGALYAVIVGHRLAALDGRANCQVCKREMIRWSFLLSRSRLVDVIVDVTGYFRYTPRSTASFFPPATATNPASK